MTAKIFIDGEAGTTGLQIRERLAPRRDLELLSIPDALRKDQSARAAYLNAADVAILCLPDDAAKESVSLISNSSTRVIDASTAYRVAAGWTYGFAEMDPVQHSAIASAAGCIREQWKGAETGSSSARFAPFALAISIARSRRRSAASRPGAEPHPRCAPPCCSRPPS